MSPIQPGTLCYLVPPVQPEYVGRVVTAVRVCTCTCGDCLPRRLKMGELWEVSVAWLPDCEHAHTAAREVLKPILPPSIDDQVERAIGNPQLEVV